MSRRRYRPRPGQPWRLTTGQHWVLSSAGDDDGVLTRTDKRSLTPLARWDLVEPVDRKKGRRVVRSWVITQAGREALATAVVKDPPPRPYWREWWDVEVVTPRKEWLVNGHQVRVSTGPYRIVRVGCPNLAKDKHVASTDTLAEALDELNNHLHQCEARGHPGGTTPAVDLDALFRPSEAPWTR